MKTLKTLTTAFLFPLITLAQTLTQPPIRYIEVNGTADMEITPNEIFVSITLKEYKDGSNKINIKNLETSLRDVIAEMKMDEKDLTIEGSYGYQYVKRKVKNQEFFMSKTYQLKMKNLEKYDELIDRLDDKGISQAYISKTSHTQIEEFKKQVKVNAVKAAKEKANLMLGALGNTTGMVLEMHELDNEFTMPMYANRLMEMDGNMASKSYENTLEMKQIKLRQTVNVKFEIK